MAPVAILALTAALVLPPPQHDIASRIARVNLPHCVPGAAGAASWPCLPVFAVRTGRGVNAWSFGPRIAFTRAAAERLSEDEFALLAAHEIAHYLLGHYRSTPAAELAADRLGAELACRAGYDPAAGASLFAHLAEDDAHPPAEARRAAVTEISCLPAAAVLPAAFPAASPATAPDSAR